MLRMMAKRPEDRPRTPGEVAEALAPFCHPARTDGAASPSTIGWSPAGNGVPPSHPPTPNPAVPTPEPAPSTTGMAWADPDRSKSGAGLRARRS